MKKISLALIILICLLTSCKRENTASVTIFDDSDGDTIVAKIDTTPIILSELDKEVANDLVRAKTEIFNIRKRGLDQLIDARLIELEAAKRKTTVEEMLKIEVYDKMLPVTETEVKSFYDLKVGQSEGAQKYEEIKDRIENYLSMAKQKEAEEEFLKKLKKDYAVTIALEPPRANIATENHPTKGTGKVKIIEFSDYECPFCKRVRDTVYQILDKYDGKVTYTFMDFPLSFHADSRKAHMAAHCAGEQDKYFEYNKLLFNNQRNLSADDLKKYAKRLELDSEKFDKCLDSNKFDALIEESLEIASKAGVSATPTFFINGIIVSGAMPYESFTEIIDEELKK
ncbi:MAG: thioredoxin domain-containing protein [Pseudomonadota bacterium]